MEHVFIGRKDLPNYLSAGLYALGKSDDIMVSARGSNIKTAVDIAEILKRNMDIPEKIPTLEELAKVLDEGDIDLAKELLAKIRTYYVKIGSEKYQDRNVSIIEINLKGKQIKK